MGFCAVPGRANQPGAVAGRIMDQPDQWGRHDQGAVGLERAVGRQEAKPGARFRVIHGRKCICPIKGLLTTQSGTFWISPLIVVKRSAFGVKQG